MRDYSSELTKRIVYVRELLSSSGLSGIVFGNSGGKDSALCGIICALACKNTVGIILPCKSKVNFDSDLLDAERIGSKYGIENRFLDLSGIKELFEKNLNDVVKMTQAASNNINPRLRMTALYAIAASENRLVAGTGNLSEYFMGYFTKWGDGGYDFNPIADLTATEVIEFLDFLKAPESILKKAPSAGLYEGQTDEIDMGVSYAEIDGYLKTGKASESAKAVIERFHHNTEHKRRLPNRYGYDK